MDALGTHCAWAGDEAVLFPRAFMTKPNKHAQCASKNSLSAGDDIHHANSGYPTKSNVPHFLYVRKFHTGRCAVHFGIVIAFWTFSSTYTQPQPIYRSNNSFLVQEMFVFCLCSNFKMITLGVTFRSIIIVVTIDTVDVWNKKIWRKFLEICQNLIMFIRSIILYAMRFDHLQ